LPFKESPQLYFKNMVPLLKLRKIESKNYRNVSTNPLGTGRGSQGISKHTLGTIGVSEKILNFGINIRIVICIVKENG